MKAAYAYGKKAAHIVTPPNVGAYRSRKIYRLLSCKFVCGLWVNIAQVIFLCNIRQVRQHLIGCFLM